MNATVKVRKMHSNTPFWFRKIRSWSDKYGTFLSTYHHMSSKLYKSGNNQLPRGFGVLGFWGFGVLG